MVKTNRANLIIAEVDGGCTSGWDAWMEGVKAGEGDGTALKGSEVAAEAVSAGGSKETGEMFARLSGCSGSLADKAEIPCTDSVGSSVTCAAGFAGVWEKSETGSIFAGGSGGIWLVVGGGGGSAGSSVAASGDNRGSSCSAERA